MAASCSAVEDESEVAQAMHDALCSSSVASSLAKGAMDKAQVLQQQVLGLEARLGQMEHKAGTAQAQAREGVTSAAVPEAQPSPRLLRAVVGSEHPLFHHIHTAIMDSQEASALAEKAAQAVQHLEAIMVSLDHRVKALEQSQMQQHMD